MPAQMTSTAWRQGATNALICSVGVAAAWFVAALVFSQVRHQSIAASSHLAFATVWALAFFAFLVAWLHDLSVRGQVLLDCGPHPTKRLFLLNAGLFPLIFLPVLFSGPISDAISIAGPLFVVSCSAYWLIMAFGRLQLSEQGIWQYWGLLRWSKIASYQWAHDGTLILNPRGRFSLLRGALPVPPERRQAMEVLLASHCPLPHAA